MAYGKCTKLWKKKQCDLIILQQQMRNRIICCYSGFLSYYIRNGTLPQLKSRGLLFFILFSKCIYSKCDIWPTKFLFIEFLNQYVYFYLKITNDPQTAISLICFIMDVYVLSILPLKGSLVVLYGV